MSAQRNREEAVNTQLAVLISQLGVMADAETIHVHGKHRPDVLFRLRGLRVAIEAKFKDYPNAAEVVLADARNRVRSGVTHIAVAVVYPLALRTTRTAKLIEVLRESQLKYRIVSETHEGDDWFEGSPSSLMDALRRVQEALTKDDIVEQTARSLSVQLEGVAQLWMGQAGPCDRLSEILGITIPKGEKPDKANDRRETAAKVSALVLANAYIFQEQLANADRRISPLRKFDKETNLVDATSKHWRWIWEVINYVPIFQIGERVLAELPANPQSDSAVRALLVEAIAICKQQTALRHDLMGRIFHWLLHNAKYLGTYYTSVSSATLLMKLVMAKAWGVDFGDPASLASFKVADLACGTGTLLMAAAQAITDTYITERVESDRPLETNDLSTLHRTLMENVLHGYDVLPSAVHLTASTLAMLAPEVAFVRMALFVMPLGMDHNIARLGSLDFLRFSQLETQMALDYSQAEMMRTGASGKYVALATVPRLSLCVMNPPFVRSVGGNLLFGSLPDSERAKLQTELKRQVKRIGANATAGLASVFIALAHRLLEVGGRMAFVVPAAIASGEAWAPSRKLIADNYHLETVVTSYDAERPNFSENTDLSEVLFIACKRNMSEKPTPTTYINLWRNPRSIHDAIDLANRIERAGEPATIGGRGFTSIAGSGSKQGEIVSVSAAAGEENWTGSLFAQTELLRIHWHLAAGTLRLPEQQESFRIPLCPLSDLGAIGPDRKRIHEGFKHSMVDWSPYSGFWGHESGQVQTIKQKPNCKLVAWLESPRGPNYGAHLWQRAGSILLVERLRTNTHRVIAIGFDEEVLGNTWWALKAHGLSELQQKSLLLWLNSSASMLLFFGRRVTTQGAWMQMKQPAWESMPVLNARTLTEAQLRSLSRAYDSVADRGLAPLSQLNSDATRLEIDRALSAALGIPDLKSVRELLAREPGINAREINSPLSEEEEL